MENWRWVVGNEVQGSIECLEAGKSKAPGHMEILEQTKGREQASRWISVLDKKEVISANAVVLNWGPVSNVMRHC